uniref:Uncharacterized protein n=1 Tax=Oryza punctata TaxID=4537 RepID=A0A0E0MMD8_ORYPU
MGAASARRRRDARQPPGGLGRSRPASGVISQRGCGVGRREAATAGVGGRRPTWGRPGATSGSVGSGDAERGTDATRRRVLAAANPSAACSRKGNEKKERTQQQHELSVRPDVAAPNAGACTVARAVGHAAGVEAVYSYSGHSIGPLLVYMRVLQLAEDEELVETHNPAVVARIQPACVRAEPAAPLPAAVASTSSSAGATWIRLACMRVGPTVPLPATSSPRRHRPGQRGSGRRARGASSATPDRLLVIIVARGHRRSFTGEGEGADAFAVDCAARRPSRDRLRWICPRPSCSVPPAAPAAEPLSAAWNALCRTKEAEEIDLMTEKMKRVARAGTWAVPG